MAKRPVKAPTAPSAPAPVDPVTQQLIDRAREMTNVLTQLGQPGNQDPYLRMLEAWDQMCLLKALVEESEKDMRLKLFQGAFPNPKEGTNVHKLPDGRELVGKHTVNRKIDEAALPAVLVAMREAGVANSDKLVRYKPELAKREWNSLSDENKLRFSPAVISTPGSPQFEIRIPKRAR
jgi:hypothetical protein